MTTPGAAKPPRFHDSTPILPVSDLAASLDYYVRALGFTIDWKYPGFASVSRDDAQLMLSEGGQGHAGTWVWLGVGDTEALYAEYAASGARVRTPPRNYEWALEMTVEDVDGNVLRLGSEPREGEPIGPWRDMEGVEWEALPGGGWTRAGPGPVARD